MTNTNNNFKGLFAEKSNQASTTGGNALSYTQQLTATSETVARSIAEQIKAGGDEIQEAVKKSMQSHDAMDAFINEMFDLSTADINFLKPATEDEIERMIRSQQSKRSRAKSKTMTFDNYLTLMTAGVAENLLRIASGKPKTTGGGAKRANVNYTDEELQKLANDQELLKKAIRNVQSKKCIMKSKANFNEQSTEYQQLIVVENQLKALRDNNPAAAKAQVTTHKIEELLSTTDLESLKGADAKELLKKINEALASK